MLVTFNYSISFGKWDGADSAVEMEITEEEFERLQEAQETGEDFEDCELVADIYEKVLELADQDATRDLIEADYLDENEKASEMYPITIEYPEE